MNPGANWTVHLRSRGSRLARQKMAACHDILAFVRGGRCDNGNMRWYIEDLSPMTFTKARSDLFGSVSLWDGRISHGVFTFSE